MLTTNFHNVLYGPERSTTTTTFSNELQIASFFKAQERVVKSISFGLQKKRPSRLSNLVLHDKACFPNNGVSQSSIAIALYW